MRWQDYEVEIRATYAPTQSVMVTGIRRTKTVRATSRKHALYVATRHANSAYASAANVEVTLLTPPATNETERTGGAA